MEKNNRQPAVAGTFYPANVNELQRELESLFRDLKPELHEQPLAVIVPHAGYVFSAEVAAKAISQIDSNAQFERIFIIGSSHTTHFDSVSIYTQGDFITPFGNIEVDNIAKQLTEKYSFITDNPQPHISEHSIEVQLPILQYWLKRPFKIVPIIIGESSVNICKQLAETLEPYFNTNNLFVISTDFSHYPKYSDANTCDRIMADAIISNNSLKFLEAKKDIENEDIDNLATAVCGWTSVLTLLKITEKKNDITIKKIGYKNSGDSAHGGKIKVVGYNALCVYQKSNNVISLSNSDKKQLLELAHQTVTDFINDHKVKKLNEKDFSANSSIHAGAFVTLRINGELRGCIGKFQPEGPLYKTIQTVTISSATSDMRFEPISSSELSLLEIEISVLTPMKKLKTLDELVLGKHGIYIEKGGFCGGLLPQVATRTRWTKEEFLGRCARDKVCIGWEGWRDANIYIYEAVIFGVKKGKQYGIEP